MKKVISMLMVLVAVCVTSCNNEQPSTIDGKNVVIDTVGRNNTPQIVFTSIIYKNKKAEDVEIEVIETDSCEYIGYLRSTNTSSSNTNWAAHKGNCKYCTERRKAEMKAAFKEAIEEHFDVKK